MLVCAHCCRENQDREERVEDYVCGACGHDALLRVVRPGSTTLLWAHILGGVTMGVIFGGALFGPVGAVVLGLLCGVALATGNPRAADTRATPRP